MTTKKLRVVDINTLADDIKSGKFKNKQRFNILQFFKQLSNGDRVPNEDTRIQVRENQLNVDFVDRVVNKLQVSGDYSNLDTLVIVYYPEKDEYKLLNGNHTSEIMLRLNILDADCYVVNYETDLGGKDSILLEFGCLLNKVDKEVQSYECSDVKNVLFQHMKEREESGLDPKPTKEYLKHLVKQFPGVNLSNLGGWISCHGTVGGRRKPRKDWREQELKDEKKHYENSLRYQNHVVLEPRTLNAWNQTAISTLIWECIEQDNRKVLLIFYCANAKQVLTLTSTDIRAKIEKEYKKVSEFLNIQIDVEYLRYE